MGRSYHRKSDQFFPLGGFILWHSHSHPTSASASFPLRSLGLLPPHQLESKEGGRRIQLERQIGGWMEGSIDRSKTHMKAGSTIGVVSLATLPCTDLRSGSEAEDGGSK